MPDDRALDTAAASRQGDFLLSVAMVCARDDAAAVAAVNALAELVSSHFRFWELVVVIPFPREDGSGPTGSPLTAALARYQNIRLLRTADVRNFYRLRLAAVAESIGDVVLLTSVEEYAAMDLVGLANRVYQTDRAIVVSRPGGRVTSAMLSLASMVSGYRINAQDTQTAGYPRGWLSLVLARPDAELLLRFEQLSGRFALRREPAPGPVPARRRNHLRRLRLVGELMANSAPRVLRGLSVLAFLVSVMAAIYTLYVLGVWMAKDHLAEGWLTTNLVQSLTAGFLGIAVAAISMGIVKVFERLEGELRYTIVDEINNVDLFRDIQDLNVEITAPRRRRSARRAEAAEERLMSPIPCDGAPFAARGWSVPSFLIDETRPRRSPYALVVPTINEGARIRRQLRETHDSGLAGRIDVIVADGGSVDGSLDAPFLREVDVRALLVKTGPGKLSAQLRCAYAYALVEGYEGIVTIDGNGKDDVEGVPRFIAALDAGIDYAQASRFIKGGEGINTPLTRLVAIRLVHAPFLSLVARRWFTDTTQGYRAYSARYLLDPRVQPFRDIFLRYELLAYLTVRASQLGYRTVEVPTRRVYPKNEKTPTKIAGVSGHSDLLNVLWKTLRNDYAPPGV